MTNNVIGWNGVTWYAVDVGQLHCEISIKLQLLKQFISYNYNYSKRKPIILQLHKVKLENRGRHLYIYFFQNKMTNDYLTI